jgi:steroid delta-isomerase
MTMNEAEVRQIVTSYFQAALNEPDTSIFPTFCTPDGILEDQVGTPPLRGREAIRKFDEAGRANIERGTFEIREIFVCGNESAVRWTIEAWTKKGQHLTVNGVGNFMFDEDRKLRHVREFFDVTMLLSILS